MDTKWTNNSYDVKQKLYNKNCIIGYIILTLHNDFILQKGETCIFEIVNLVFE